MALKSDLIRDSGLKEQNGRIIEIRRIFRVTGLTGGSGTLKAALAEAGLPAPNSVHPDETTLRVLSREVKTIDGFPTECFVEVTYGYLGVITSGTSTPTLSGGTGLETLESAYDRNGAQITTTHNGITQGGTISVPNAQSSFRFTRTQQTGQPGVISKTYVNRVNSTAWMGGNPGEWLCTNIAFDLVDDSTTPDTYQLTYEFQFKEGGWQPKIVYIDPDTGQPPPNLQIGTGVKVVDWFFEINFHNLIAG